MNNSKALNRLRLPLILLMVFVFASCTSTKKVKTPNGISEIQYMDINGAKQYVLIRGTNRENPVLLFLHGGPGASATALLRRFNGALEDHFTVVYWDQRGAGKSYNKHISKDEIKVKQYIADAEFLVNYLKSRFSTEKIFLVGHSWGSRLGMYLVQQHPEDFLAFVGVGQELAAFEGEFQSYQFTLQRAKETNNQKAIRELEEIGAPQSGDFTQMYSNGFWGLVKQKDWLLKLGGERYGKTNYTDWIFSIWFSREYGFFDLVKYGKGSGFSAGNAIYDPDFNNFNFFEQIPEVQIPVFFISGAHDYNTPWPLVEEYFGVLRAPHKEFIKFEFSGHSPVFEEPERFNKEIVRIYNTAKAR
jgi:proline iminopeptidase